MIPALMLWKGFSNKLFFSSTRGRSRWSVTVVEVSLIFYQFFCFVFPFEPRCDCAQHWRGRWDSSCLWARQFRLSWMRVHEELVYLMRGTGEGQHCRAKSQWDRGTRVSVRKCLDSVQVMFLAPLFQTNNSEVFSCPYNLQKVVEWSIWREEH